MKSWAGRQRLKYTLGFFGILFLISVYPVYSIIYSHFNKPPTCYDNTRNQDETGIDCGGICELACVEGLKDIQVLWTRIFQLNDNTYDLAAYIENSNKFAGIRDIGYTFIVYDDNGMEIYKRDGFEYINPREQFVIFEPNVFIDEGVPAKVLFKFDQKKRWIQMKQISLPIVIKEKVLINEKLRPRINATIRNRDFVLGFNDLDIVATVSDAGNNVIAASATHVERIESEEEKSIFLIWPTAFRGEATERTCSTANNERVNESVIKNKLNESVHPTDVILVFDRSGSMNDDGGNPIQPLTNAKDAARSFVDAMNEGDRVGLVSFATKASNPIDQQLTENLFDVKDKIEQIIIYEPDHEQHTNLGDAIKMAREELTSTQALKDTRLSMVILTDGVATRPIDVNNPKDDTYAEEYAAEQAKIARESGVNVHIIALGSNINDDFLSNQIATSKDYFYKAHQSEELTDIYTDIATAICLEDVYTVDFFIRSQNK